MAKKKVFVSFDYDKNKIYKFLLNAWDANPDFEFGFNDHTPTEIQSSDISRVKAAISTKISQATCTLVIVGDDINKQHKDRGLIGYDNWQHFEIAKSKELGNKIIFVKIDSTKPSPNILKNEGIKTVNSFNQAEIIKAIKD